MGRHSESEHFKRVEKDCAAIEAILGDQAFLFGDKPSSADYSTVPMLRSLNDFKVETGMAKLVSSRPKLSAYLDRGKEPFYPKV